MRASGLGDVVVDERDHVCAFYRGTAERDRLVRAYLDAGLAAGEKCISVLDVSESETVADYLRLERLEPGSDQLAALSTEAAYLTDGRFDPGMAIGRWSGTYQGFVDDGYAQMRAVGDLAWFPRCGESVERLFEYEQLCDGLRDRVVPLTRLCLYDLEVFGGALTGELIAHHAAVLTHGTIFRDLHPGDGADEQQHDARLMKALVLTDLLMVGARSEREVEDLVLSMANEFSRADVCALARPVAEGWEIEGRAGCGPLDPGLRHAVQMAVEGRVSNGPGASCVVRGFAWTVCRPLAPAGGPAALLVVGSRESGPASDAMVLFVQVLAVLASNALQSVRARQAVLRRSAPMPVLEPDDQLLAEVSAELLEGTLPDTAENRQRLRLAGCDPSRSARVIVARSTDAGVLSELRRQLRLRNIRLNLRRSGELVAAIPDQAAPDILAAFTEQFGPRCTIGIGLPATSIPEFAESHGQARMATSMAEELRLRCARFDDLGVLRVLVTGGELASVRAFIDDWLGPLRSTDAGRPGELLETLSTFLDLGANQRAAADALGIHVSTMRYRLRRIGEITGRDLDSAETRFEFQLAYQAWKSLAAISRQGE